MELIFQNVSYSYDGKIEALKDVSFKVGENEKIALLGLNGSGKSTLMQLMNGLLKPTSGKVTVNGHDTNSKGVREVRKIVGLVFQDPDDQLFMPTVREDVAFGPLNMGLSKEEVEIRVNEALEATHTKEFARKSPYELSGGQKKAVSIATVLSMEPQLLVMDEPTSGLDYEAMENLISIVKKLDTTLIISTHDIEVARRLCGRAIVLRQGSVAYDGEMSSLQYPQILNSFS